ncbi:hypothetical protein NM208_g5244 [Fusarium decemcellulare]|uniref:Uncharacterized protein n=1 Tax=Fusarium decemcellulare TaxID=57161 RepID=A0ACC1SHS5_9HYPO|nr:hypothetical protein NM208_g5244 [Fusarium decemcellulare]
MFASIGPGSRHSRRPPGPKQNLSFVISIDRHFESKVYTSGSTVSGKVTVESHSDLTFERVEVALIGTASTHMNVLLYSSYPSTQTFLRLDMPAPERAFGQSCVLRAGRPEIIPFTFVVPFQLSSAACRYRNPAVHQHHLQPPPTVGPWEHDDLFASQIQVDYSIRARVVLGRLDGVIAQPFEANRRIKVLPFFPTQPPLDVSREHALYHSIETKTIRQNFLSPSLGQLTASLTQPTPIVLSIDRLLGSESSLTIDLQFMPKSKSILPPDTYVRSMHIRAASYASLSHMTYLPDRQLPPEVMHNPVLSTFKSIKMSIIRSETLPWAQPPGALLIRDSIEQLETTRNTQSLPHNHVLPSLNEVEMRNAGPDAEHTGYRAALLVSFALPACRQNTYLPTFFSCLLCRVYSIHLTLGVEGYASTLNLTAPLQIATASLGISPGDSPPSYVSNWN